MLASTTFFRRFVAFAVLTLALFAALMIGAWESDGLLLSSAFEQSSAFVQSGGAVGDMPTRTPLDMAAATGSHDPWNSGRASR